MRHLERDSNYELLRIVSMLFIVMWHVLIHGNVLSNTSGFIHIILRIIQALLVVHVNSFILVTGYYQSKSDFKFKKFFSLNNAVWFYRVLIFALLIFMNVIPFHKVEALRNLFPIDLGFYWFIDAYLILYCISPFLNLLISHLKRFQYHKMLMILFLVIPFLSTLTGHQAFNNNFRYSITNFVFLYLLGAYFRDYKIEIWDYFNIQSEKMKQLIYLAIFLFFAGVNFAFYIVGHQLLSFGEVSNEIGRIITMSTYTYDNPFVLVSSLMYFLYFGSFHFSNSLVNKLSSLSFGVYLIHDNPYVRQHLYELFALYADHKINSYMIIPIVILVAIMIFVVCLLIEWLRQLLFSFISKCPISKAIKNSWYQYLNQLKNKINNPVKL